MSAIQKIEHESEATNIIQVIERAALNPTIDVEKMERLLAMHERILTRDAKAAYIRALAEVQLELPVITERGDIKNREGKSQSKYALWEDINETIKPTLAKHGFALSFRTGQEGEKIVVTGVLSHRDGHSEETSIYLPTDTSGSKNAVQAVGSSTSYGKRYTAQALLNLTSRGEDDDGKASGGEPPKLSDEQVEKLQDVIIEVGADPVKLLEYLNVERLQDIYASKYDEVRRIIERKRTLKPKQDAQS